MPLDIAIIETNNGGDCQINSNDLAVIFSIENQCYLAWFGGNKKEITQTGKNIAQSFDWWGNDLLMKSLPTQQFNSLTEATLDKIAVTSQGRNQLELAMKKDIEFLSTDFGAITTVEVTIESDDRLRARVTITIPGENEKIIIVNFRKESLGDFWFVDFNDDFLI